MEYILNLLKLFDNDNQNDIKYNIYDICDICDIIINGNIDGKGLKIGDYILTLNHIIDKCNHIYVNSIKYYNICNIDVYDICVFGIHDDDKLINDFMLNLEYFIRDRCLKLIYNSNYQYKSFKIYNKTINLKYDKIDNINLKSYIYPPIPMGIFNITDISENELDILCASGISGNVLLSDDKYFGMIVSQNSDKSLEILPFEIIYDIIKSYYNNAKNFLYLPLTIDNNVNQERFGKILKNDYIIRINNKLLNENNIFIDRYDISIPYQTYILMYNNINNISNNTINIEIIRNKKNIRITDTISIQLHKYNFKKIFLNFKKNDYTENIFNCIFKELSEEFLIENNYKDICEIKYNNIYNKKKLIYLDNIDINNNISIPELDMKNTIYILNKISGHKINNLNDITKYMNNKQITFELLDPNNNIIKIKL